MWERTKRPTHVPIRGFDARGCRQLPQQTALSSPSLGWELYHQPHSPLAEDDLHLRYLSRGRLTGWNSVRRQTAGLGSVWFTLPVWQMSEAGFGEGGWTNGFSSFPPIAVCTRVSRTTYLRFGVLPFFLTNYFLFTTLLQYPDRHDQIRVKDQQL